MPVKGEEEEEESTKSGPSRRKRRSNGHRIYRQADLNGSINSSYINILKVSYLCDP